MNVKILPVLFSTLACMTPANPQKAIAIEDVYKVTSSIWIKNLYFRDGHEMNKEGISKVITFDIVFHSTSIPYDIYVRTRETDLGIFTPPTYILDDRQGMQYQHVELDIKTSIVQRIVSNDVVRVTYGDLELFSFKSPALMTPINSFSYSGIEKLPSNLLFQTKINLPRIKNGMIEPSYNEYIDLSKVDFAAIQNYYYGKFPDQYLWVKCWSDLYEENTSISELRNENAEYNIVATIYLEETKLFEDYHLLTSIARERPFWCSFIPEEEIDNYYHLAFANGENRYTSQDGVMKRRIDIDDELFKYLDVKKSKFVTYPLDLDDFEYNFELAKNMNIVLMIEAGIYQNFHFTLSFQNNLRKDFFYNHLNEMTIKGSHNNKQLETVDIVYA